MKRDLITILCMTLVCASVMLGIMGVYRIVGTQSKKSLDGDTNFEITAFKPRGLKTEL